MSVTPNHFQPSPTRLRSSASKLLKFASVQSLLSVCFDLPHVQRISKNHESSKLVVSRCSKDLTYQLGVFPALRVALALPFAVVYIVYDPHRKTDPERHTAWRRISNSYRACFGPECGKNAQTSKCPWYQNTYQKGPAKADKFHGLPQAPILAGRLSSVQTCPDPPPSRIRELWRFFFKLIMDWLAKLTKILEGILSNADSNVSPYSNVNSNNSSLETPEGVAVLSHHVGTQDATWSGLPSRRMNEYLPPEPTSAQTCFNTLTHDLGVDCGSIAQQSSTKSYFQHLETSCNILQPSQVFTTSPPSARSQQHSELPQWTWRTLTLVK